MEITATEQSIQKRVKRNEDNLKDLWGNIKQTNIHIPGVSEGERERKGTEKIFEDIIAENSQTRERKESPTSRKHSQSHTG